MRSNMSCCKSVHIAAALWQRTRVVSMAMPKQKANFAADRQPIAVRTWSSPTSAVMPYWCCG